MKKVLLWLGGMMLTGTLLAAGAGPTIQTADKNPPPPPPKLNASFIGGFWFGVPASIRDVDVEGVKLGLPISSGYGSVYGFEWGLFCCATERVHGFQWTIAGASLSKDMNGFQLAPVNYTENDLNGMQMGIVNLGERKGFQLGIVNYADSASCQIGLVNFNKNGWMPFMVGFNRSK